MQLGIYLQFSAPRWRRPARRLAETLEQARLIRSLGFDSIWAGEHHVTPGFHFFPQLSLLTRVAAEAEGLWLGTNVTCCRCTIPSSWPSSAPFSTWQRAAVSVRHRSRLPTGGICHLRHSHAPARGTLPGSHRDHPAAVERGQRRSCWALLAVQRASIRPRPLRSPHLPIIIGAQVEAAIERAAKIGDGWLIAPIPTTEQLARQLSDLYQRPGPRQAAAEPSYLPAAGGWLRRRRRSGHAPRRTVPDRRVQGLLLLGLEGLKLDPDASPQQQFRTLARNRFAVGTPEPGGRRPGGAPARACTI